MDKSAQLFVLFGLLMLGVFLAVILAMFVLLVRPWMRAFMSGAPISLFDVVGMRLRGNPVTLLIDTYLMLKWKQIPATIAEVERCYMENRNIEPSSEELMRLVAEERGEQV